MNRDLRERLRRSFGATVPDATAPAVRGGGELRDYLRRRALRATGARPAPVELPAGRTVVNAAGSCWVVERRYGREHAHGSHALGAALSARWEAIAALGRDERLGEACATQCLFLDTETTGLAGGAGTVVFLTGVGWFEPDAFVLEQVFLRDFTEEAAALHHVARRLAERPLLVTYVGKAFDRHRLASRMALHGVTSTVLRPRHLDLYYLARRAFRGELPDVRLRTVEERRLGVLRRDDLPGREAPRAWLDWLRHGTGPVDRVLEHNRQDVLSLVVLLAALGQ